MSKTLTIEPSTESLRLPDRAARSGRREPGALAAYAFSAPALVLYAAFVLVPVGFAVFLSFQQWSGAGPMEFVGIDNYVKVLTDPSLVESFLHAFVLVFFFAAVPVVLGLLLTGFMTHIRVRGLVVYRTVLFLPQILSLTALAVVWEWILGGNGLINQTLTFIGLGQLTNDWLGSYTWALPAIGVMGSWIGYGFAMVLFMAGVEKIPQSLYEAASLDGAGAIRQFWSITLPGLRNEMVVVSVLTVTNALTSFDIVYLMTVGGPGTSTIVPAFTLFNLAFTQFQVGAGAAMGVILAVMVFLIAVGMLFVSRNKEDDNA
jgi:raffinose/stachyose/melibiose transport system permease protein